MKKAGIIMVLLGPFIFAASVYDLFGNKSLPVPLTVSTMLTGIACTFLGPAFLVFHFPYERRKKIATGSFFISLFLIITGLICSQLHIPGARVEIMTGVFIICFFYGSLAFRNKYEKWRNYARSAFDAFFLSLFDFLGVGFLFLGFLFKIQHWPLSDLFTTIGLITLAIGVLAWNQKFKKEVVFRKEAEDRLKLSHQELEEKQKEIIDSITYARRIQSSLLPTEKYIENSLERLKSNKQKQ
jgi:hypothetical protein